MDDADFRKSIDGVLDLGRLRDVNELNVAPGEKKIKGPTNPPMPKDKDGDEYKDPYKITDYAAVGNDAARVPEAGGSVKSFVELGQTEDSAVGH